MLSHAMAVSSVATAREPHSKPSAGRETRSSQGRCCLRRPHADDLVRAAFTLLIQATTVSRSPAPGCRATGSEARYAASPVAKVVTHPEIGTPSFYDYSGKWLDSAFLYRGSPLSKENADRLG